MRCPSCGADVDSAYCGYCGTKMPIERVETTTINAENVTVNNYYGAQPQQDPIDALRSAAYSAVNSAFANTTPVSGASPKSRMIALLLCIFLGFFGAHRFYTGHYLIGAIYLFTIGVFGIGWIVDIVLIAIGKFRDKDGLVVANWDTVF